MLNKSRVEYKEFYEVSGLKRVDQVSASVSYEGFAPPGALTSEPKWQIRRVSTQGFETVYEYANNGEFDQVWDNRASLFGTIPFSNVYSVLLDGINDYIDLSDNLNYERTQAWTWSFWYRPRVLGVNNHGLFTRKTSSQVGTHINIANNGRVGINLRNTASTNELSVTAPAAAIGANTWYNIVCTYDGSSLAAGTRVYINGVNQTLTIVANTLTGSILSPASSAVIGHTLSTGFADGHIDEVSHWNRVLTQAEVTELFNIGSPSNLASHSAYTSLLNWWRMGENTIYPTVFDSKGTINGTMTNMSSSSIAGLAP